MAFSEFMGMAALRQGSCIDNADKIRGPDVNMSGPAPSGQAAEYIFLYKQKDNLPAPFRIAKAGVANRLTLQNRRFAFSCVMFHIIAILRSNSYIYPQKVGYIHNNNKLQKSPLGGRWHGISRDG